MQPSGIKVTPAPILTYLLTPWSRVLLEKLTGFAAGHEIPRIYGTRKFITVLTSVRHTRARILVLIRGVFLFEIYSIGIFVTQFKFR
jgi:hypothetical protein